MVGVAQAIGYYYGCYLILFSYYLVQVYQAVRHSILPYGSETWSARVADEVILVVFGNDRFRTILRLKRRDCVPSLKKWRRLHLTCMQIWLCWFGDVLTVN